MSYSLFLIAYPLLVLFPTIYESIANFALSLRAREVILGVPLDNSGHLNYDVKNMNGKICLNFSFVLACMVRHICPPGVTVRLYDERYTTQEAKLKRTSSSRKSSLDAVAAQCILERYLEEQGGKSIEAIPCHFPPPEDVATFNYDLIRQYVRMQHRPEDHENWDTFRAYVENYKVYQPLVPPGFMINTTDKIADRTARIHSGDGVDDEAQMDNMEDIDDNYDDDDDETMKQRKIVARRRPVGMSKAAWKLRLAKMSQAGLDNH